MAKKKQKKKNKNRNGNGWAAGNDAMNGRGGLMSLLPSKRSEQFLLGAVLGAAAAYVLSDEEVRGKLMKAGVKLYASLAGGMEEIKEQMADIKAEIAAEESGAL